MSELAPVRFEMFYETRPLYEWYQPRDSMYAYYKNNYPDSVHTTYGWRPLMDIWLRLVDSDDAWKPEVDGQSIAIATNRLYKRLHQAGRRGHRKELIVRSPTDTLGYRFHGKGWTPYTTAEVVASLRNPSRYPIAV